MMIGCCRCCCCCCCEVRVLRLVVFEDNVIETDESVIDAENDGFVVVAAVAVVVGVVVVFVA
jgi:hypothetical protein